MSGIHFGDLKYFVIGYVINIGLTALHIQLSKLKEKTSSDIDNKLDGVVTFLLNVLNAMMFRYPVK